MCLMYLLHHIVSTLIMISTVMLHLGLATETSRADPAGALREVCDAVQRGVSRCQHLLLHMLVQVI